MVQLGLFNVIGFVTNLPYMALTFLANSVKLITNAIEKHICYPDSRCSYITARIADSIMILLFDPAKFILDGIWYLAFYISYHLVHAKNFVYHMDDHIWIYLIEPLLTHIFEPFWTNLMKPSWKMILKPLLVYLVQVRNFIKAIGLDKLVDIIAVFMSDILTQLNIYAMEV